MDASEHQTPSRRSILRGGLEPRDREAIASIGSALSLTAGGFLTSMTLVVPSFVGHGSRWQVLTWAALALLVGLLGHFVPHRVPVLVWSLLPFPAIAGILGVALATGNTTGSVQVFLVWPVFYASYLLKNDLAWVVYGAAAISALVFVTAVKPPGGLSWLSATLTTLAAVTVILIRVRNQFENAVAALSEQALRDPLTRLANRRAFDSSLLRALAQADRAETPLCLLAVDLDLLKVINDLQGHSGGDTALQAVARSLSSVLRAEDRVARIGGDEFVALLNNCPPQSALELADRVRQSVSQHMGPNSTPLTISIGVASYPTDAHEPDDLHRAADQALYCAKRNGRDQVQLYSSVGSAQPRSL